MGQSEEFPLCNLGSESFLYIFRDCIKVKDMWLSNHASFFSDSDWLEWLYINLISVEHVVKYQWRLIFGVMLDLVWWRRNGFVFNNNIIDNRQLGEKAMAYGFCCSH